jgi:16S rRNA (adenine1518-N6/adenine1519-N6)-dimethyltransferase
MRRRRLGQHYLVSADSVKLILNTANIQNNERVLEIGTGEGALTVELARIADELEAYEIDRENYRITKDLVGSKVALKFGDAFLARPKFDVLVSSLPYSESSTFVEWLSMSKYDRAVVVLQEDFAKKITAKPGTPEYRAVSVLAQISSNVTLRDRLSKEAFDPPPMVASRIAVFEYKRRLTMDEVTSIKKIFGLRRRELGGVLRTLGLQSSGSYDSSRRVVSFTPDEVYRIIRPK